MSDVQGFTSLFSNGDISFEELDNYMDRKYPPKICHMIEMATDCKILRDYLFCKFPVVDKENEVIELYVRRNGDNEMKTATFNYVELEKDVMRNFEERLDDHRWFDEIIIAKFNFLTRKEQTRLVDAYKSSYDWSEAQSTITFAYTESFVAGSSWDDVEQVWIEVTYDSLKNFYHEKFRLLEAARDYFEREYECMYRCEDFCEEPTELEYMHNKPDERHPKCFSKVEDVMFREDFDGEPGEIVCFLDTVEGTFYKYISIDEVKEYMDEPDEVSDVSSEYDSDYDPEDDTAFDTSSAAFDPDYQPPSPVRPTDIKYEDYLSPLNSDDDEISYESPDSVS